MSKFEDGVNLGCGAYIGFQLAKAIPLLLLLVVGVSMFRNATREQRIRSAEERLKETESTRLGLIMLVPLVIGTCVFISEKSAGRSFDDSREMALAALIPLFLGGMAGNYSYTSFATGKPGIGLLCGAVALVIAIGTFSFWSFVLKNPDI